MTPPFVDAKFCTPATIGMPPMMMAGPGGVEQTDSPFATSGLLLDGTIKPQFCVAPAEDAPSVAMLEALKDAQRALDNYDRSNPWKHFVLQAESSDTFDIVVWVPEVLFNVDTVPCPCCGITQVTSTGWGEKPWVVVRPLPGSNPQYILSRQYLCQTCGGLFRAWNPNSIAHLPQEVSSLFPIPRDRQFLPEFRSMRVVIPGIPSDQGNASQMPPRQQSLASMSFSLPRQSSISLLSVGDSIPRSSTQQQCGSLGIGRINSLESDLDFFASLDAALVEPPASLARQNSQEDAKSQSSHHSDHTDDHVETQKDRSQLEPQQTSRKDLDRPAVHDDDDDNEEEYKPEEDAENDDDDDEDYVPPHLLRKRRKTAGGKRKPVAKRRRSDPTPTAPIPAEVAAAVKVEGLMDPTMAEATLVGSVRAIQFCAVCYNVRRRDGHLLGGHKPDGYCPVKGRTATLLEKRELRRRRQKMRRAVSKQIKQKQSV